MTQITAPAAPGSTPGLMIDGAIPLIDVAGHLAGDSETGRKAAAQLRWALGPAGRRDRARRPRDGALVTRRKFPAGRVFSPSGAGFERLFLLRAET